MAIVLVVLAVVGGLLLRDSGRTIVDEKLDPVGETVLETTTTSVPPVTTADAAPPLVATTEPDAPVDSQTTASTVAPSSQPTSAPTTSPAESTTSPTTAPTTVPSTVASTEPEPTVVSYVAIANTECASGFRAPLEQASLRYLGPNQGWDRLDDLVDEQDGPFYFEAWEPNYPNDVTVEITLLEPVRVTEIMVAQDPYTPVSGDIDIDSVVAAGAIQLSGIEGWRGLDFPSSPMLSSFTIRRDAPTENIMEVMVCVVDPAN